MKHCCLIGLFVLISIRYLVGQVSPVEERIQHRSYFASKLTLLENKGNLIPFQSLDTLNIGLVTLGEDRAGQFETTLKKYTKIECYTLTSGNNSSDVESVVRGLKKCNVVIIALHTSKISANQLTEDLSNTESNVKRENHPNDFDMRSAFERLTALPHSVVVLFGDPVELLTLKQLSKTDALLLGYEDLPLVGQLAAEALFGGIPITGRIADSLGNFYPAGAGITSPKASRLSYTDPEEVGLNGIRLQNRIDSIVSAGLSVHAFPGCNVLIAKSGRVIFQKAYGFHTYDRLTPSTLDDIYDLASVTKVTGALPALMKLHDQGKYDLDIPYSTYWPDWKKGLFHRSNKSDLTARELLTHQAGLVPYLPFWKQSMKNHHLSSSWYAVEEDGDFTLGVTPELFLNQRFKKKVYRSIRLSPLETRGKYVYSCLSFILAPEIVKRLSGVDYLDFLDREFYRPLGATTTTYCPWRKYSREQVVPTEFDAVFRHRLVHNSVHDEASAVLGGISGNAGLFSSANDLAKLLQMYLQKGEYGGKRYLSETTLDEFNTVQYAQTGNRRALGFDKPLINNQNLPADKTYPCPGASPSSFGHSGFTGTFFWVDPKYDLVYIFLCNRVNPTRENNKLGELNIRTNLLQIVYEEILKSMTK